MSQCAVILLASLRGNMASVFSPLFKSRVFSYIMASLNASHPPGVAKTPRSCPSPDSHAPSSRIARLLWDLFFFFLVLMLLTRRPLRMPTSSTCLLISQAHSRRASQLRKRAVQSSFVRFHGKMIQGESSASSLRTAKLCAVETHQIFPAAMCFCFFFCTS